LVEKERKKWVKSEIDIQSEKSRKIYTFRALFLFPFMR